MLLLLLSSLAPCHPMHPMHPMQQPCTPCSNHAATMQQPCSNHAATMHPMQQPCSNHAATMQQPCSNHAATMQQNNHAISCHLMPSHAILVWCMPFYSLASYLPSLLLLQECPQPSVYESPSSSDLQCLINIINAFHLPRVHSFFSILLTDYIVVKVWQ